MTPEEVARLLDEIDYKPGYSLSLGRDVMGGRYYLQAVFSRPDVVTKEVGLGFGGKVYLSPHMTRSEIVRKALGAYLALEEHECRENFTWRGRRIFGPHIDVEALWSAAPRVDVRS